MKYLEELSEKEVGSTWTERDWSRANQELVYMRRGRGELETLLKSYIKKHHKLVNRIAELVPRDRSLGTILKQAIESGKQFKRLNSDWLECSMAGHIYSYSSGQLVILSADDLLADDWEIERPKNKVKRKAKKRRR